MSTLKNSVVVLIVGALLSGCADKSGNVQASYVSPMAYSEYSCKQLSQEAARISGKASSVAGVQDKNASSDAVATGVALVLFWPAAFFIKGNKDNRTELARLKGEMEAIEQVGIQKKCNFTFSK